MTCWAGRRTSQLPEQAIDPAIERIAGKPEVDGRRRRSRCRFGLLARKETDALFLEATGFNRRLNLDLVARRGATVQDRRPVRRGQRHASAGAEGGARARRRAGRVRGAGAEAPRRQPDASDRRHADQRIGLCAGGSERPDATAVRRSRGWSTRSSEIARQWPLKDFLDERARHALLDVVLRVRAAVSEPQIPSAAGLAACALLSARNDRPRYSCGLDGDFDTHPELRGWLAKAHALAQAVASMRPRTLRYGRAGTGGRIPCLEERTVDGRLETTLRRRPSALEAGRHVGPQVRNRTGRKPAVLRRHVRLGAASVERFEVRRSTRRKTTRWRGKAAASGRGHGIFGIDAIFRRRMPASFLASFVSHSQMRTHRQPAFRRSAALRASRCTFPSNLAAQYSTFEPGEVALSQWCRCQKHPWTNTAMRLDANARSGVPGRPLR